MKYPEKIRKGLEKGNKKLLSRYLAKLSNKAKECPRCDNKTIILWAKSKLSDSSPMCDNCFDVERRLNQLNILKYEIFFLPEIDRYENEKWDILNNQNNNYDNILNFIDKCIDASKLPNITSSLLTYNIETLSTFLQLAKKSYEKKPPKKRKRKGYGGFPSDVTKNQMDRIEGNLIHYRKHKLLKIPIKLSWRLIPPGCYTSSQIKSYFKSLYSHKKIEKYDWNRLETIQSFKPDSTYIGLEAFEGYMLFYFGNKDIAILDCPIIGNAIYILKKEWNELSRLPKSELIDLHSDKVSRIIHRGNWVDKLVKILG